MRPVRLSTIVFLLCTHVPDLLGQDHPSNASRLSVWSVLQVLPSYTWTQFPGGPHFAFEWEAAPLLYSFGRTRIAEPWKFFIVEPPARFAGSIEFVLTGQVYTTNPGTTRFGWSGQILTHLPVVERGEYLAILVGAARYTIDGRHEPYLIGGFSTLFGFLQTSFKYSPSSRRWMTSLEIRMF